MKKENVAGIYIHIPFCIRKCLYCDFLSGPAEEETREAYVRQLIRELDQICRHMKARGQGIRSVYFGGGTPSVLEAGQIIRIMDCLKKDGLLKPDQVEISLEMNPGTVTEDKLKAMKEAGINRLSMGMQSFVDEELRCLGRIHSVDQGLMAFAMARKAGFDNISIDLMSGLPGQTRASYASSLDQVVALAPEHISAYSLILEEGTPFYDRYQDYWTEEQEELDRELYQLTLSRLKAQGYDRYEISNYSKPGRESRHNSSYWTGIPYYGCGLGASSLIEDGGQWIRCQNQSDMETYLALDLSDPFDYRLSCQEVEVLSLKERMEEFMFLGLRMTAGIREKDFQASFGCSLYDIYGEVLDQLMQDGLLKRTEEGVALTDRGLDLSDYCFRLFV